MYSILYSSNIWEWMWTPDLGTLQFRFGDTTGALYKLDPLETKGLYLVRFSKGCILKHFSVAVVNDHTQLNWEQLILRY